MDIHVGYLSPSMEYSLGIFTAIWDIMFIWNVHPGYEYPLGKYQMDLKSQIDLKSQMDIPGGSEIPDGYPEWISQVNITGGYPSANYIPHEHHRRIITCMGYRYPI